MATNAVTCLQTTGRTYTHVFLCGGCRCLSAGSIQLALAAIGSFALLIAFNWPMSESTHFALIIGGSLSIALALIGIVCCKIPKRVIEEPKIGLEQDITMITPPPSTPYFDMTGTIASVNPNKRSCHAGIATFTPSVARKLDFDASPGGPYADGSVEILADASAHELTPYAGEDFTSIDAGAGWRVERLEF